MQRDWADIRKEKPDYDFVASADRKWQEQNQHGKGRDDKSTIRKGMRLVCIADVEARPVQWIWPNRIAGGKFGLLTGDPDMGKSLITCDMIARITKGAQWPDGGQAAIGNAIMLSSEDGLADTIRPRLEAAGADLARVHVLQSVLVDNGKERAFSIQADLAQLEACLASIGDVHIITIDPITAYMGGDIDSHRTTDVRSVLEPFIAFAERMNVAILGITHPTKAAQSKAINSFTGSLAYLAASRLAFMAVREPETDRRLFLPVKNNLGPAAAGLGYSIQETIISKGLAAPHIVWDGEPVTVTANEAVRAGAGASDGKLKEATEWLEEELTTGPKPATAITENAKRRGITKSTLRRARQHLGVVTEKAGLDEGWWWKLAA